MHAVAMIMFYGSERVDSRTWLAVHCATTCVCICVCINEDGLHTMLNDRQARELLIARRRRE